MQLYYKKDLKIIDFETKYLYTIHIEYSLRKNYGIKKYKHTKESSKPKS